MKLKDFKQFAKKLGYKPYFKKSWKEFDEEDLIKIIIKELEKENKVTYIG